MKQIKITLTEAIMNDAPAFAEQGYSVGDNLCLTVVPDEDSEALRDGDTGPHPKDRTHP